ncbi:MAG: hypothetical protein LBE38_08700 [Deltaproteobacteria bacterium]|jgi:hypothetical protein|nr:hypothetical protein [Deltaproteobacteria bacterium]
MNILTSYFKKMASICLRGKRNYLPREVFFSLILMATILLAGCARQELMQPPQGGYDPKAALSEASQLINSKLLDPRANYAALIRSNALPRALVRPLEPGFSYEGTAEDLVRALALGTYWECVIEEEKAGHMISIGPFGSLGTSSYEEITTVGELVRAINSKLLAHGQELRVDSLHRIFYLKKVEN